MSQLTKTNKRYIVRAKKQEEADLGEEIQPIRGFNKYHCYPFAHTVWMKVPTTELLAF